jgi:polar amino acid transport system substrate-binding protein
LSGFETAIGAKYPRGSVARVPRSFALLLVAGLAFIAAGCGGSSSSSGSANTTTGSTTSCNKADLNLVNAGQLTVGTDNPAFPPWFGGNEKAPWKVSDPRSGEGFESAVAYAVAKQLGFANSEVKWTVVPFNTSYAPGTKKFDFDINEVSFTPARAKVVDFSDSYYDVSQSIVGKNGTKIANAKSVADLKPYKLGAQIGTTSYQFIKDTIKPSKQPSVFDTNDAAVAALKNGQIDGLVVDLPTAFYVTAVQVPNSKIIGQFESTTGEHFGMVFEKGNALVKCVNSALAKLKSNGTLQQIQDKWLAKVGGAPVLK